MNDWIAIPVVGRPDGTILEHRALSGDLAEHLVDYSLAVADLEQARRFVELARMMTDPDGSPQPAQIPVLIAATVLWLKPFQPNQARRTLLIKQAFMDAHPEHTDLFLRWTKVRDQAMVHDDNKMTAATPFVVLRENGTPGPVGCHVGRLLLFGDGTITSLSTIVELTLAWAQQQRQVVMDALQAQVGAMSVAELRGLPRAQTPVATGDTMFEKRRVKK